MVSVARGFDYPPYAHVYVVKQNNDFAKLRIVALFEHWPIGPARIRCRIHDILQMPQSRRFRMFRQCQVIHLFEN